ncbi:MAG: hypothetical protein Q9216_005506 [Gyalolechia sp. 2 TL-2023]
MSIVSRIMYTGLPQIIQPCSETPPRKCDLRFHHRNDPHEAQVTPCAHCPFLVISTALDEGEFARLATITPLEGDNVGAILQCPFSVIAGLDFAVMLDAGSRVAVRIFVNTEGSGAAADIVEVEVTPCPGPMVLVMQIEIIGGCKRQEGQEDEK